jgi:hypothetical protein
MIQALSLNMTISSYDHPGVFDKLTNKRLSGPSEINIQESVHSVSITGLIHSAKNIGYSWYQMNSIRTLLVGKIADML